MFNLMKKDVEMIWFEHSNDLKCSREEFESALKLRSIRSSRPIKSKGTYDLESIRQIVLEKRSEKISKKANPKGTWTGEAYRSAKGQI